MLVYAKSAKIGYHAIGEYDSKTNKLTVKKGSVVSDSISESPTFRGAKTIRKLREEYVEERTVLEDIQFKSSSAAANFITGRSANGLFVWKTKDGITIKKAFSHKD